MPETSARARDGDTAGAPETVTLPLEAWRQILRRVRQLEALDRQRVVILRSLVDTIEATPADEAGDAQ